MKTDYRRGKTASAATAVHPVRQDRSAALRRARVCAPVSLLLLLSGLIVARSLHHGGARLEFAATAMSPNVVALTWTDHGGSGRGYVIERATGAEAKYVPIAAVGASDSVFVDRGACPLTHYFYRLQGKPLLTGRRSAIEATVTTGSDPASLDVPAVFTASPVSATSILISWQGSPASRESGFLLERSTDHGLNYHIIAAPAATAGTTRYRYTDFELTPQESYLYRLRAHSFGGPCSPYTSPAEAATPAPPPGVPTGPHHLTAAADSTFVALEWEDTSGGAASFRIERAPIAGGLPGKYAEVGKTPAGAHRYVDAAVTPATPYYYRVVALTQRGNSDYCRPLNAITASARTPGGPHTYDVGPGQPLVSLGNVPWNTLGPGDTVRIHDRETPYREKLQISSRGTATQPICVVGVPGPKGRLPIIDGQNATTSAATSFPYAPPVGTVGTADRGLVTVTVRPGYQYGFKPGYIDISGLEIRNACPAFTYTDGNGVKRAYSKNAAAVYIERGEHILIRHCTLTGAGNGLFAGGGGSDALSSSDFLIESNNVYGNGTAGGDREHNAYCEAKGIIYQYNHFGPLRPGALGNNIKDRSSGTIVRYNWIESGAHLLDLVEPQESYAEELLDPDFVRTLVYGNVLFQGPGAGFANLLHYGGDNGDTPTYRKGMLYFYHNTVVMQDDRRERYRSCLLQLATNEEAADVRNNIVYVTPKTHREQATELCLTSGAGVAAFGANWVSPGWVVDPSERRFAPFGRRSSGTPVGLVFGAERFQDNPQNDPGFVSSAARDFRLAASSPCIDRSVPLPADVRARFPVSRQYGAPQSGLPRLAKGKSLDFGAFEYGR